MSARSVCVALLALTASTAAVAQNPITLRVRLREGQTMRYKTDIETWLGQNNAGVDTTQPARVLTLYTTRTVAAVRNDTAIIRDVVDSAMVRTPALTGVDTSVLRRAAEAMRGVVTLTATDGRGRLLDYAAGSTQDNPVDPALQAVMPMGGLLRVVFVLPAEPVRVGQTWSERVAQGDGSSGMTMSARYTLERTLRVNDHDVASIRAAGEMGGGGPGGAMSARFDGNLDYDMVDSQPTRFVVMLEGTLAGAGGDVPMKVRRTVVRL